MCISTPAARSSCKESSAVIQSVYQSELIPADSNTIIICDNE